MKQKQLDWEAAKYPRKDWMLGPATELGRTGQFADGDNDKIHSMIMAHHNAQSQNQQVMKYDMDPEEVNE